MTLGRGQNGMMKIKTVQDASKKDESGLEKLEVALTNGKVEEIYVSAVQRLFK